MTLKTQMADDAPAVFLNTDEFAETVTYTPSGGSGRSIKAIVELNVASIVTSQDGQTHADRATLYASRNASTGIPSPSHDDQFTISGNTWKVVDIPAQDDAMVALDIIKLAPHERSSEGYRQKIT